MFALNPGGSGLGGPGAGGSAKVEQLMFFGKLESAVTIKQKRKIEELGYREDYFTKKIILENKVSAKREKKDSTMELTEEQRERIRKNRERALAIRKQRQEEQEKAAAEKRKLEEQEEQAAKKVKKNNEESKAKDEEENIVLEDFEIGASDYVTKKEAMKMYCLPEGTLAVCPYIEKENPKKKGWVAMKLYSRSEIRRRARERFGGMEGLMEERQKRENKRFEKDLELTKNVFR